MNFGPLSFAAPLWLLLLPIAWGATLLIARRTLSGMGGWARRASLGLRLLLLTLLVVVMGEPSWRKVSDSLALVVVADASRSMPPGAGDAIFKTIESSAKSAESTDRIGLVTVAKDAEAQVLPDVREAPQVTLTTNPSARPGQWRVTSREATDLASGIQLAIAAKPESAAGRIVLASDGNETDGSVLAAAATAKALGIPIDVLPVPYSWDREVIFEAFAAPATARQGQTLTLRMVLNAMRATRGRLTLVEDGVPVDISPDEEGVSLLVDLEPGTNVIARQLDARGNRAHTYKAVFEPLIASDDAVVENNTAMAVTFVSGEGRVLVYSGSTQGSADLVRALRESKIDVDVRDPAGSADTLLDLQAYDAIVLADVPSDLFSLRQQEELAAFVRDTGGGLLMVGGPDSFGAGGWIGTPVAEVLPVRLDPPEKRQMPRGALAMVMHSCEMPQGNYFGQQTALAAAKNLSRLDLIGVVEFSGFGGFGGGGGGSGVNWAYPLSEVGDGTRVRQAINGLMFGDMPDFNPIMQAAHDALVAAKAGIKHCIVVSDGDPQPPTANLLASFKANKITISAVEVFPHGGAAFGTMQQMAQATGGNYYLVATEGQAAKVVDIIIKEAQTVKRSLIWEGDPVAPTIVNSIAEPLRGITGLPSITGYVVTADREGLALVTARGPENDPIIAQWQHGLGRVVAFTSDATTRWASSWVGWSQFRAFWEQHVRWTMRPSGSANLSVATQTTGENTKVVVTALDDEGDPLDFASFTGRALGPDLKPIDVPLRQTGPGRYEGSLPTAEAGAYTLSIQYEAAGKDGAPIERGSAQAAITRPYADEHRALKDNTPLLRQVAEMTGGRVLEPARDGAIEDLFSREGVKVPVALTPIWFALALSSIGLFLVDVAVRRVRIDLVAIARAGLGVFRRTKSASGQPMGELRAARQRAQTRLSPTSTGTAGSPGSAGTAGSSSASTAGARNIGVVQDSGRKFEADPASMRHSAQSPLSKAPSGAAGPTNAGAAGQPKAAPGAPGKGQEDQGMSRLLSAKKRARESMGDEAEPSAGGGA